ncbi:hypothetical protein MMC28_008523 [Mycoblastus sanguinarius]|nr:hypothetical protein [Mycoblastus sanguinarius]
MLPLSDQAQTNYDILRDCLSEPIIQKSASKPSNSKRRKLKGRKHTIQETLTPGGIPEAETNHAEDLADFIDYLTLEIFTSLPPDLHTLSYSVIKSNDRLASAYTDLLPPTTLSSLLTLIPPSVPDSLEAYALLNPTTSSLPNFLSPVLNAYIASATSPPPSLSPTQRATACEICLRDWIPLTYHHLIPRAVHAKVVKRGWHEEWRLSSVAWLCRACHSFVHRVAGNEELGREYWSVERLMGREDVQGWARWVGRVRWKKR